MAKTILFLLISIISGQGFAEAEICSSEKLPDPAVAKSCSSVAKSGGCDYYTCLDTAKQCSTMCTDGNPSANRSNYLLDFGHKYCRQFEEQAVYFTPSGKTWLGKVRSCLQTKLVDQIKEKPQTMCRQIEDFAYDSHIGCYVESGFCRLNPQDVAQLVAIISPELENIIFKNMFIRILAKCNGTSQAAVLAEIKRLPQDFGGLFVDSFNLFNDVFDHGSGAEEAIDLMFSWSE